MHVVAAKPTAYHASFIFLLQLLTRLLELTIFGDKSLGIKFVVQ